MTRWVVVGVALAACMAKTTPVKSDLSLIHFDRDHAGEADKLEASLKIAQAEKERLERLLVKARLESDKQKNQKAGK